MELISTNEKLITFCKKIENEDFIAVDTEFIREDTYWPKVCLIQIAGSQDIALIDPLSVEIDLLPLFEIMKNENIIKVFHSAYQDLEIFYFLMKELPKPIFDTQIAAMVCGFGESVGYETLVNSMVKTPLDKSSRYSNWARRPLTDKQLKYAANDVIFLRIIYQKLFERLQNNDRFLWIKEEMEELQNIDSYKVQPEKAWQRLRPRSGEPRFLARLQALGAWRELEAVHKNIPRGRMLRDEILVEIAAHNPNSSEELCQIRGISTKLATGIVGTQIMSVLSSANEIPSEECPTLHIKIGKLGASSTLIDLLRVLLKIKSQESQVAERLIATTKDLDSLIMLKEEAPIDVLKGWRYEIFGKVALDFLNGKVSIFLEDRKICVKEDNIKNFA
ncbi:MAG: ribonuclease D [Candidatus Paracaedimonas acanthamoebae]|uniref:Ribonuclease D n=1 Tax=Candidatus Paracaedimonas acanthamoebae TaxID=244581 RepID=A0A8J7PW22_9PROT|nr:ribonuclease D [Candidatus Paracaedimonas acanthamoebae]